MRTNQPSVFVQQAHRQALTTSTSNKHTEAERFFFGLQVFRQAGPPQRVDWVPIKTTHFLLLLRIFILLSPYNVRR